MEFDPLKLLLLMTCFCRHSRSTDAISNLTQLYQEARIHYLDEEWQNAIESFEELLVEWNEYQKNLLACRQKCASNVSSEDSGFLTTFQLAACQLECRPAFICDKTTERDLLKNMPYNYLQLAYYKMNDLEQAAASAFTHYLKNMDDDVAIANVKHFRAMPGVRESYFRDRNLRHHIEVFASAPTIYTSSDNKADLLGKLHHGFLDFLGDMDSCVAGCQSPINKEEEFDVDDGDLASNLGIHLAQFLNCTIFCEDIVSKVDGSSTADYFLIYLLYLHSVALEVGDEDIYSKTIASVSMLNLSDDELANMDISPEAVHTSHSEPFSGFSNYLSRKRQTNSLSDLLAKLLSGDGDTL